jgi:hypothetical protein
MRLQRPSSAGRPVSISTASKSHLLSYLAFHCLLTAFLSCTEAIHLALWSDSAFATIACGMNGFRSVF